MGDAEERASGARVARAVGEEAAFAAAPLAVQALPDDGDQPQGEPADTCTIDPSSVADIWCFAVLMR